MEMANLLHRSFIKKHFGLFLAFWILFCAQMRFAAAEGVTIITHGWNSDTSGWVTGMANAIGQRLGTQGLDLTVYPVSVARRNLTITATPGTRRGANPITSNSNEIVILLDWSTLSKWPALGAASTGQVASALCTQLRNPSFIPELNGHALAELPIHVIGHSRGSSLACEIARILGANGIFIDHLTSFDAYTVPGDGSLALYDNVLFADSAWRSDGGLLRTTGRRRLVSNADKPFPADTRTRVKATASDSNSDPNGRALTGAYNRNLALLDKESPDLGYSLEHYDTHLWYHGTIDLSTGASDSIMPVTQTMRSSTNWWSPYENRGVFAGFFYSRIGGGDRLSVDVPVTGGAKIRDGYSSLYGGTGARISLSLSAAANWPNLITFDYLTAGVPAGPGEVLLNSGQSFQIQYRGRDYDSSSQVTIFFDADQNPLNSNFAAVIDQRTFAATGKNTFNPVLTGTTPALSAGLYRLGAQVTDGQRKRFLYSLTSIRIQ